MTRRLLTTIVRLLGGGSPIRRAGLPVLLYRWRYEICGIALIVGLLRLGPTAAAAIALVAVVALVSWPGLRARVRSRLWAIVVQHRLRSAFRGAALATWDGRAPAVVWSSPRPSGVRVTLALPAGLELRDIQELHGVLAAACFASVVVVDRSPRHANVVMLFVVMRSHERRGSSTARPEDET